MHVKTLKGHLDRIFFDTAERLVHLVLEGTAEIHSLRVSDNSMFRPKVMLSKVGDMVIVHTRNGHVDKWENCTMDQPAPQALTD